MSPKVLPLKDQVVLVTGCSRGVGRAIALAFARQGVLGLVISTKSSELSDDFLTHIDINVTRVVVVKADVTKADEVERLFATAKRQFGYPITTVVNNARIDFSFDSDVHPKISSLTWEAFEDQLRGCLQGVFNTTKAALPGMRECAFGRIINVAFTLAQNLVVPSHDYAAGRSALLAFTHATAAELGSYNITVNLVSGGLLKPTDSSAARAPAVFESPEHTPPRKHASPEEIADVVLFLASPWARGVNGQSLFIDGVL